jgi:hypothetical protein
MESVDRNFVLSQGLDAPSGGSCAPMSSALRFQPRLFLLIAVVGVLLQSAPLFAVLGVVLWWAALVPRMNPFNTVYNMTLGRAAGAPKLEPALAPRRFAMGMAGTFNLAIAASLASGWFIAAFILEAFLLIAATAVGFGRLCLGSFIYYLVRGQTRYALATLPWGRGA